MPRKKFSKSSKTHADGTPKRKPGRPKGSKNKPKIAAADGSLAKLERALLYWVAEHGASTVRSTLEAATRKLRSLV